MRSVAQFALLVLVCCTTTVAQVRVPPSIYSSGGMILSPPPASINSFNPMMRDGGGPLIIVRPGSKFSGDAFRGHHHHQRGCFSCGAAYGIAPYYYYYPGYGIGAPVEEDYSLPNAGKFSNSAEQPVMPEAAVPTLFDRRPQTERYRPTEQPQDSRYGEHYADGREVPRPRTEPPSEPASAAPPSAEHETRTVLVFRDGHEQEIENYAIMGRYIFVFAATRTKIPLENLNLPATQKANDERGLDFHLPGAGD